jgi:hypothetical protein
MQNAVPSVVVGTLLRGTGRPGRCGLARDLPIVRKAPSESPAQFQITPRRLAARVEVALDDCDYNHVEAAAVDALDDSARSRALRAFEPGVQATDPGLVSDCDHVEVANAELVSWRADTVLSPGTVQFDE